MRALEKTGTAYLYLLKLFHKDDTFKELIKTMRENKTYFKSKDLLHCDAMKEVVWWLHQTNISCRQSRLFSREDLLGFAFFIIFLSRTNSIDMLNDQNFLV